MNRPIDFIESKTSEDWILAKDLIQKLLEKTNQSLKESQWVLYVNEDRWDDWNKKIKPRTKIVLIKKLAQEPEIHIVKQEDGWVVVNKPYNLPTQATLKRFEDNLYERVRKHFVVKKNYPKKIPYVGLHHRLDRGTSGLVLMTLKKSFNKEVSSLFKERRIQKEYICYTEPGVKAPPQFWREENFIKRESAKKKKFFFQVSDNGDKAISEFKLIDRNDHYNIIKCFPKTGRTHQLRVQLSHLGYPILGDAVYGRKKSAPRLMLHAFSLGFKINGQDYKVECDPDWPEIIT